MNTYIAFLAFLAFLAADQRLTRLVYVGTPLPSSTHQTARTRVHKRACCARVRQLHVHTPRTHVLRPVVPAVSSSTASDILLTLWQD